MRIRRNGLWVFLLLVSGLCPSSSLAGGERSNAGSPPPDEPAEVTLSGREITVEYEETVLFRGEVITEPAATQMRVNSDRSSDRINQTILLTSTRVGTKIRISGMIYGSTESFPCESDRRGQGLILVRHSSGLSKSYLNRAVYDRKRDWLFSVDANPSVLVKPLAQSGTGRSFSLEAEGGEIVLRFRPLYYRKHRGLSFFEPWNYRVWPGSVAGWISWFAFYDKITEDDVVRTVQVVAEVLRPFGYEYIQIDDGYERDQGLPEYWLQPNEKFPHGLGYLSEFIKSKGLKPAIWTNVSFRQRDFAEAHKNWFVLDAFGNVARGNWIELSLDASQPEALNSVVRPIYRGLKKLGWEYFKVDALRHLRYEGYNANGDYFKRKGSALAEAYRRYVQAIREEIGRDSFLNACWGIRPELTGIVDGCRLGTDGFSYAGLSQYNSFNNVVWRNDPDHIRLDNDAYSSTMVTSLTGSMLLLTDKPEVYRTGAVEPAKRTAPVLFTLPGQVFDVDPSRSDNLYRVDSEVSGSGPRVFDAGLVPGCHLFLLEVYRPFEDWTILGRTGGEFASFNFADLGLDPAKEYFVFEFWTKKLLGSFAGSFPPGPIDPRYKSQVFCIREKKTNPQVLATSRHITCGGVDLVDANWKQGALLGRSQIIRDDPYTIYVSLPEGFQLEKFNCPDAHLIGVEKDGILLKIALRCPESRCVSWSIRLTRRPTGRER